jgi:hypothetical protein
MGPPRVGRPLENDMATPSKPSNLILPCALLAGAVGCSLTARGPEQYRDDTQALLETRRPAIKECYDAALKSSPTSEGRVTVRFTLASETGKIVDAKVDETSSTAPEAVRGCVLKVLDGLVLSPPDDQDGHATFVWEFRVAPPTARPPT